MFSKKSLLIVATALLAAFCQAAPVSSDVVNQLKQASTEDINALGTMLTGGINGVIHLSQASKDDQTSTLKNYLASINDTADSIKQATGSLPPQLDGAVSSLKSYVQSYKAPAGAIKARALRPRAGYDPTDLATHQTGMIGNSEGTQMAGPLANDVNGLLQSNSAAGGIYKAIDNVDQLADGALGVIGNVLAPVTLGGSKAVTNFLTGPIVQSLTHGTYDAVAHLVGTPIDMATGASELAPADAAAKAQQQQAQQAQPQQAQAAQRGGQAKN